MSGRVIAVGDIHGCSEALRGLLRRIRPTADDTLVTLGDYVNRGPDSMGVIDTLIDLRDRCRLIPLLGNHDDMALHDRANRTFRKGAEATDPETGLALLKDEHFEFLGTCLLYFETARHFFVHANYDPEAPLDQQDFHTLLYLSLSSYEPARHRNGKTAIVGHSSQKSGEVLELGPVICIDTYCWGGGWLTGLDVDSGQLWQVDREGRPRRR